MVIFLLSFVHKFCHALVQWHKREEEYTLEELKKTTLTCKRPSGRLIRASYVTFWDGNMKQFTFMMVVVCLSFFLVGGMA